MKIYIKISYKFLFKNVPNPVYCGICNFKKFLAIHRSVEAIKYLCIYRHFREKITEQYNRMNTQKHCHVNFHIC